MFKGIRKMIRGTLEKIKSFFKRKDYEEEEIEIIMTKI